MSLVFLLFTPENRESLLSFPLTGLLFSVSVSFVLRLSLIYLWGFWFLVVLSSLRANNPIQIPVLAGFFFSFSIFFYQLFRHNLL